MAFTPAPRSLALFPPSVALCPVTTFLDASNAAVLSPITATKVIQVPPTCDVLMLNVCSGSGSYSVTQILPDGTTIATDAGAITLALGTTQFVYPVAGIGSGAFPCYIKFTLTGTASLNIMGLGRSPSGL